MTIAERIAEENPEAVLFDDLDDALLGFGCQYGQNQLAVYSVKKIIEVLQRDMEMSYEDAVEWFDYNIGCLYAGKHTPIIVYDED